MPGSLGLSETHPKPLLNSSVASIVILPGRKVKLRVTALSRITGVTGIRLVHSPLPQQTFTEVCRQRASHALSSSWSPPAQVYGAICAGFGVPHATPLGTLGSWREPGKPIRIEFFLQMGKQVLRFPGPGKS